MPQEEVVKGSGPLGIGPSSGGQGAVEKGRERRVGFHGRRCAHPSMQEVWVSGISSCSTLPFLPDKHG